MSKPFAVIGFSWFIALILAVFLGETVSLFAAIAGMVLFAILIIGTKRVFLKKYTVLSAALVTVSLAFLFYSVSYSVSVQPYQALDQEEAEIRACVLEVPEESYGRFYYKLRVEQISFSGEDVSEVPVPFTLRMSATKAIVCEPMDYIDTTVRFYRFNEQFGFSSASSYLAGGIPIAAYSRDFDIRVIPSDEQSVRNLFNLFRRSLTRQVQIALPKDEASLINAMLLGKRDAVSDEINASFRQNGITHLLVVSGLHMSILSMMLLGFLKALRVPGKLRNLTAIVAVVCFMLLTGLQGSVLRSGLTTIIFLLADSGGRETDGVNSLGFAVLLIGMFNPFIGGDIGFLLSVSATLGILLLHRPMSRFLTAPFSKKTGGKLAKAVIRPLAAGISAVLLTLPLQIYLFGTVSLLSPVLSLILTIPVTILMYTAFIALVFACIPFLLPLAQPFLFLAGLSAKLILWAAEVSAKLKTFSFSVQNGMTLLVLCGILILIVLLCVMKPKKTAVVTAVLLSVFLIGLGAGAYAVKYHNAVVIAVADEGEDSCVVALKNGAAAVLSLGGYNTKAAEDILRQNNISRVNSLLLLTDDRQEEEAALNILRKYDVEDVYCAEEVYQGHALQRELGATNQTLFSEKAVYTALPGIDVYVRPDGCMEVHLYGMGSLVIERGEGSGGSCDVLITNRLESNVNSAFTVLQTDDIILEELAQSGAYLFAAEHRVTYLDFYPDGTAAIRREH